MELGYFAPQPAVAEIIVARGGIELQSQTRVSGRREIGIRHERGVGPQAAPSKGNELASVVNSFTAGPCVAQRPAATCHDG